MLIFLGVLAFIFAEALWNLCILPCDVLTYGLYPIFGALFGIFLGFIIVLGITIKHDKNALVTSPPHESTQYRKRKNDEKSKNLPSFPRSDKRINDNRTK